jgi:hypothetical protein
MSYTFSELAFYCFVSSIFANISIYLLSILYKKLFKVIHNYYVQTMRFYYRINDIVDRVESALDFIEEMEEKSNESWVESISNYFNNNKSTAYQWVSYLYFAFIYYVIYRQSKSTDKPQVKPHAPPVFPDFPFSQFKSLSKSITTKSQSDTDTDDEEDNKKHNKEFPCANGSDDLLRDYLNSTPKYSGVGLRSDINFSAGSGSGFGSLKDLFTYDNFQTYLQPLILKAVEVYQAQQFKKMQESTATAATASSVGTLPTGSRFGFNQQFGHPCPPCIPCPPCPPSPCTESIPTPVRRPVKRDLYVSPWLSAAIREAERSKSESDDTKSKTSETKTSEPVEDKQIKEMTKMSDEDIKAMTVAFLASNPRENILSGYTGFQSELKSESDIEKSELESELEENKSLESRETRFPENLIR